MKVLRWRIDARDPAGRPRTVVRRAATAELAFGPLVDAGWQPVRVEPAGSMLPDAFQRPPGPDRLAAWFGALRTVVDSGMPLSSGLALLGRQFGDPRPRELSDRLARTVSEGIGLSSALVNTASWVPVSATMLVRCGEQSGRLPESLAEVQRQLERAAVGTVRGIRQLALLRLGDRMHHVAPGQVVGGWLVESIGDGTAVVSRDGAERHLLALGTPVRSADAGGLDHPSTTPPPPSPAPERTPLP